ncbi:MAG: hypothetical protein WC520_04225, partial [Candidatus Paceibacterota bacterium]
MKKKSIFNLIFCLIFAGILIFPTASFALESKYPVIFNHTIDKDTGLSGYVVYFYIFFVAIGSVVAFATVFSAGLEFMMSGGEPAKISSARTKFLGAFVGLLVLYGSYFILDKINSSLTGSNDLEKLTSCDDLVNGKPAMENMLICVEKDEMVDGVKKTKVYQTIETAKELNLQPGEEIRIRKYSGAKEIWAFSDPNFKGTPTMLYGAWPNDPNRDNNQNEVIIDKIYPITSAMKSFKILNREAGMYFYSKENFDITDGQNEPLFLSHNIENLATMNMDEKILSIDSINPNRFDADMKKATNYMAIAFTGIKYTQYCYDFVGWCPDFDTNCDMSVRGSSIMKKASSLLVFKTTMYKKKVDVPAIAKTGKVVFYNTPNCEEYVNDSSKKSCEVQNIMDYETLSLSPEKSIERKVVDACPNFGPGDTILSLKITGPTGVVLRGDNNM